MDFSGEEEANENRIMLYLLFDSFSKWGLLP